MTELWDELDAVFKQFLVNLKELFKQTILIPTLVFGKPFLKTELRESENNRQNVVPMLQFKCSSKNSSFAKLYLCGVYSILTLKL